MKLDLTKKVKYANPLDEMEQTLEMEILEYNEVTDRYLVRPTNHFESWGALTPTFKVNGSELVNI